MQIQPSLLQIEALRAAGNLCPVYAEVLADLETPVSAFLKVAEHAEHAFLLETVEGGQQVGRYSFLGKGPFLLLRSEGGRTIVEEAGTRRESDQPFIETLRGLMDRFRSPFVPGLPRFTGGAVGCLGYESAAWFEPSVARQDGRQAPGDAATFMLFDTILAFDHVRHRILLIANARITGDEDLRALYQFACDKIAFLESELQRALSVTRQTTEGPIEFRANMTQAEFEASVPTRSRSTGRCAT